MTTYTLIVEVPQAGKEVQCEVSLTGSHENHPEDYFRKPANRQAVQSTLKTKLQRDIEAHHVDGLISQWMQGIKRGKTRLKRQLDLHLNTDSLTVDSGVQQTPSMPSPMGQNPPISPPQERSSVPSQPFYPPKPPRPIQPIPKPTAASSQPQSQPNRDNAKTPEDPETESISVESISNTADF